MSENVETSVYNVNSKVLSFGIIVVLVLIIAICGGLLLALFSMSSRYFDQRELTAQNQETVYSLRRALDRAEGKLQVYEAFLVDRQEDIVQKLILRYLRKERVQSDGVTLRDFERWVGIGGP